MSNRLHHSQSVLNAMRKLAEQRCLPVLPCLAVGDVDERNDNAVDFVLNGPVGPQSNVEPSVCTAAHFLHDRREMCQHQLRILDQIFVLEAMGEIGYRPSLIMWRDADQFTNLAGEALYAQARIQEQDPEICGSHQILKVAVAARNGF